MSDIVVSVRSVDDDLSLHEYPKQYLDFGYRESRFSQKGGIVLSTGLCLKRDDPQKILAGIAEMNRKRTTCQPLNMPSAGSAFKRPVGQYAGALIEAAGMKGYSIGGAKVSEKHAGFIVNTGEAKAEEICELMRNVIAAVREHSGVTLEPEIRFIGKGVEE
jgi:UDP-N-acetylmuramate dehydrogenase